jgi:hypothetical protein
MPPAIEDMLIRIKSGSECALDVRSAFFVYALNVRSKKS